MMIERMLSDFFDRGSKFSDYKELCSVFFRDLTEDELQFLYKNGKEALLSEKFNMDEEDYKALFFIRDLLSAYCSKNEEEYEKVLEEGSFYNCNKACDVFTEIADDIKARFEEDESNGDVCDDCELKTKGDVLDKTGRIASVLTDVLNAIPDSEKVWLDEYRKIDENCTELIRVIGDCEDDSRTYNFDEVYSLSLDAIKDTVVSHYADVLKLNKGVQYTWNLDIVDEVSEYLYENEDNISISVRNNTIVVR